MKKRTQIIDTRAPVTYLVCVGEGVAAGFGDGVVRFFQPSSEPVAIQAHSGVVLSLAADEASGSVPLLAEMTDDLAHICRWNSQRISNGSRWVDCVAVATSFYACSSELTPCLARPAIRRLKVFEHPSTVGGLALDMKAQRLAVAHYGGATVWKRGERRWKPAVLFSHGAVGFSPDGKYLVTAMHIDTERLAFTR